MTKSNAAPLISVCVPVYDTEPFLERCLRSAAEQDFDNFEIVVASDASRGKDARGRNAKKIVKAVQKECDKARKSQGRPRVAFKFVEHSENRGLIEVRRSLCHEASGLYITQLDSDDELEAGALRALWSAAKIPAYVAPLILQEEVIKLRSRERWQSSAGMTQMSCAGMTESAETAGGAIPMSLPGAIP